MKARQCAREAQGLGCLIAAYRRWLAHGEFIESPPVRLPQAGNRLRIALQRPLAHDGFRLLDRGVAIAVLMDDTLLQSQGVVEAADRRRISRAGVQGDRSPHVLS